MLPAFELQGPAIKASGLALPISTEATLTMALGGDSCSHQPTLVDRSCDERCKEWMRCKRPRLELGMELNAYEPGMVRYFHDLRQPAVRRPAGNTKTVLSKLARVTYVHFIPVPVTFADRGRP